MRLLAQPPHPIAVSQSLLEIPLIVAAIFPGIFTIALRQTVDVLALVLLAVGEVLAALAVFEAVFEVACVEVAYRDKI
jgi:hypothetical protein